MSEHTPLPWTIKHEFNIFGPNERLVAGCGGRQSNLKEEHFENSANAEFIIRAVNSHDALVEALEAIRPLMIPGMNWTDETGQMLLEMADKALAAAKGELHDLIPMRDIFIGRDVWSGPSGAICGLAGGEAWGRC